MSEILLIQPPQWYPVSPYLAVPLLVGQLKQAGFNRIEVFADRRLEAPAEGEQRIYLKARKGRIK